MTDIEVKGIRKQLRVDANTTLRVICDNMKIADESKEYVIWDDNNSRLFAIRVNEDYTNVGEDKPIEVMSTTYDQIQFIEANYSLDNIIKFTEPFIGKGLSQTSLESLLKEFNPVPSISMPYSTKGKIFDHNNPLAPTNAIFIAENGKYVTCASLEDAISKANPGDTVYINGDVNGSDSTIVIDKDINIKGSNNATFVIDPNKTGITTAFEIKPSASIVELNGITFNVIDDSALQTVFMGSEQTSIIMKYCSVIANDGVVIRKVIESLGPGSLIVKNVFVSDLKDTGDAAGNSAFGLVYTKGNMPRTITIDSNTFKSFKRGIELDKVALGNNVIISHNTFTDVDYTFEATDDTSIKYIDQFNLVSNYADGKVPTVLIAGTEFSTRNDMRVIPFLR